jgi:tetratricopeptide (TPR) repeat protein
MATSETGNTRLRSARQGLGLRSQQALADAVTRAGNAIGLRISVTSRTVRRWESDAPSWPHPEHQAALEALFQRPVTELGFTPPWAEDRPAREPANRHVDTPPGAAAASGPAASHLPAFAKRVLVPSLSGSVAADFIAVTTAHRHMYWAVPTSQLHDSVAAHVHLGTALLPAVPEVARRALAAAVSESSLLAGRIEFFDLQYSEQAQASFVLALQAAQDARDPLLAAAVLAHMAFIPAFSGEHKRAEEARDKVRAARAFSRRGPASPELLAWLDAVEAEVETRFGDTRKALQLIHHAEGIFANEAPGPSPAWLDWFSPARLAGFKGNTLMTARQPAQAKETLQSAIDQLPKEAAKQRSVLLADLAAVAVSEKEPDRACALAEEALDQLTRTWYATGMERVRAVRQSLTPWESLPCVRQLDERLYDWNTTVSALTG